MSTKVVKARSDEDDEAETSSSYSSNTYSHRAYDVQVGIRSGYVWR